MGSITRSIDQWRDGDPDRQFDLDRAFRPFLLELVRRSKRCGDPRLNARIDSQGVVNEVLHDFLVGIRQGTFAALTSQVDAKRLLTRLVRVTLLDEIDKHTADKRSIAAETCSPTGRPEHVHDARGPTLVEMLHNPEFAEWCENLLKLMRSAHPNAIEIVEMSLKGHKNSTIAQKLDLSIRAIQNVKKQLWNRITNSDLAR
jgi:hypothetical protein